MKILTKKYRFLLVGILVIATLTLSVAALNRSVDPSPYQVGHARVVIRNIGHQLLLQTGDSSSRVLPVNQLRPGIFQLEFENPFAFTPDSLVTIVRANLTGSGLPANYLVDVLSCNTNDAIYGFEVNPLQNIIPCQGRAQVKDCYRIQFTFADLTQPTRTDPWYLGYLAGAAALCLTGFVGQRYLTKNKRHTSTTTDVAVTLGRYSFYHEERVLKDDNETITLSDKESHVLAILAAQLNQLVSRDQLLKQVWEDDGVFTGRSLDVFISKLRKKFAKEPDIQIINVHGKGYKLQVKTS